MLLDDAGELSPVRLDPALVNSDNAVIVLDEYHDTCWVFIGRNVNMPTRMHALRMGKAVQKSGHKIGVTTIGMSTTNLVEMLEKDDSDPEVAQAIERFRSILEGNWSFDDQVLAYRDDLPREPIAGAPATPKAEAAPKEPVSAPPERLPIQTTDTTIEPEPSALSMLTERKTAILLLSVIKHTELTYSERFERDGKTGVKIESPGVLALEILMEKDNISINPPDFGDSEVAKKVKAEYETLIDKLL